jgi:hypothetical protein
MQLRFLGTNSTGGDCPTLYVTDEGSYIVQGWEVYANDMLMQLDVPEGQTVVEVPTELFEHLKRDGLPTGAIKRFEAPIMVLTPNGTCIVQGKVVTDAEALSEMSIPAYESCVEVPKASIAALLEEPRGADLQR